MGRDLVHLDLVSLSLSLLISAPMTLGFLAPAGILKSIRT